MARLRYNGLSTTLGGSLTNVATSVTFAAALTHSNGTNVPTIVAPDYIPLAILGATGHLSEIVYLTAYTAAGTTGTITRGQEGTAGAAHSSGDTVTQAQLVGDYTGEGGGDYFRTGFYNLGVSHSGTGGTLSMTANTAVRLRPFVVSARRSFDRIGINLTTAATASSGGLLRMGIYASGNGAPGALLLDAGTVSSEGALGAREITIATTLDIGLYWLAAVGVTAACTVTAMTSAQTTPYLSFETTPYSGNAGNSGVSVTTTSGTLPAGPLTIGSTINAPFICLRAA